MGGPDGGGPMQVTLTDPPEDGAAQPGTVVQVQCPAALGAGGGQWHSTGVGRQLRVQQLWYQTQKKVPPKSQGGHSVSGMGRSTAVAADKPAAVARGGAGAALLPFNSSRYLDHKPSCPLLLLSCCLLLLPNNPKFPEQEQMRWVHAASPQGCAEELGSSTLFIKGLSSQ
jgi:hypothetical protein